MENIHGFHMKSYHKAQIQCETLFCFFEKVSILGIWHEKVEKGIRNIISLGKTLTKS
jgi:hypothetical protein